MHCICLRIKTYASQRTNIQFQGTNTAHESEDTGYQAANKNSDNYAILKGESRNKRFVKRINDIAWETQYDKATNLK